MSTEKPLDGIRVYGFDMEPDGQLDGKAVPPMWMVMIPITEADKASRMDIRAKQAQIDAFLAAPVEPVPAPVGLDLSEVKVVLELEKVMAPWKGEFRALLAEWVKTRTPNELLATLRASLSPRPATGASTSGRRETGPEIAKRLGIKVKDQQDQIDIESGKRIGEDPATGAREDDSDFPPIGEAQHLCRKCSRPTDLHRAGDFLIWQCHHCKLLWHSPAPATGAREWLVIGQHMPEGYWIVDGPPIGPDKFRVRMVEAPATGADQGGAAADLREAVALAVTDYSAGGEDISHTVDRILSLVHPQAPKAGSPTLAAHWSSRPEANGVLPCPECGDPLTPFCANALCKSNGGAGSQAPGARPMKLRAEVLLGPILHISAPEEPHTEPATITIAKRIGTEIAYRINAFEGGAAEGPAGGAL